MRAVVGQDATSGDKTKLQTEGDIEVLASTERKTQLMVQGSVSKPKGSDGAAVSISIGVGVYGNDNQAVIRGNTQLDAYGTIKVDSKLTYPLLTKPEDLLFGIPQDIVNRGVSGVTTMLDGTFGVSTKLMNNWVMSYGKAAESQAVSVSGSIATKCLYERFEGTGSIRRGTEPDVDRRRVAAAVRSERCSQRADRHADHRDGRYRQVVAQ